jgi:hypothetical protein
MLTKTQKLYITEDEEVIAAWEQCWENILRLPPEARLASELFTEAKRLVCICRARTKDKAVSWLKEEVEDGQVYVAKHLAIDPDDVEWRRIQRILAGAQAGLAADLTPDRLDNKGRPKLSQARRTA